MKKMGKKKETKMKTAKSMRVGMIRMEGDIAPFLFVAYFDKDDELHPGLMVVDSCSCENILFGDRLESNGVAYKKVEGTLNIGTISNEMVTADKAECSFIISNYLFNDIPFYIADAGVHTPKDIKGVPIIGIIGNKFLQMYHLVIDYSDYTLYTSNTTRKNLAIEDCDFFYPMNYGLKRYGIPVVQIRLGDKKIAAGADSGSTSNTISIQALEEEMQRCSFLDSTDTLSGVYGEVEAKDANIEFDLATAMSESNVGTTHHHSPFKVIPHLLIDPNGVCDDEGKPLLPVKALIGSPFMAAEKWVLDFGARIIYKRKQK